MRSSSLFSMSILRGGDVLDNDRVNRQYQHLPLSLLMSLFLWVAGGWWAGGLLWWWCVLDYLVRTAPWLRGVGMSMGKTLGGCGIVRVGTTVGYSGPK